MKKKCLILAAALSATSLVSANYYAGTSIGYLIDGKDPFFAVQAGYSMSYDAKSTGMFEVELGYTSDEEYSIDITTLPIMANYRFQYDMGGVKLEVGGGLGMSRCEIDSYYVEGSDWAFTWQVLAGVEFPITDNASLRLGYRHLNIGEVEMFGITDDWGSDDGVEVGLRLQF